MTLEALKERVRCLQIAQQVESVFKELLSKKRDDDELSRAACDVAELIGKAILHGGEPFEATWAAWAELIAEHESSGACL